MKQMVFLLLACQLFISGCTFSYFSMTDNRYIFKSNRIAVIPGLDEDISVYLAEELAKELADKTTFKVMSSKEIARKVPGYPLKIRGPYSMAYFGIDNNYKSIDKSRIQMLQSKLGVDYLYILWAPSVVQGYDGIKIHIIAQLFEFPSCTEIAHARYYVKYTIDDMSKRSCFNYIDPKLYDVAYGYKKKDANFLGRPMNLEEAVKGASEKAVQAIIKATGKGKSGYEHGAERDL